MTQAQTRDPRSARKAAYWTTTILTAFFFLSGGAAYLFRVDIPVRGVAALGYPVTFITLLGMWKVLGGLAILSPRTPLLKEWAYAGITFDLTGAAFSHTAAGDPVVKAIVPLVLLAIAAASWALRPPSRRLGAATGDPERSRSYATVETSRSGGQLEVQGNAHLRFPCSFDSSSPRGVVTQGSTGQPSSGSFSA